MRKEFYLKKVIHETYGELYQFLEMDAETGQEQVINPFATGLFLETVQEPEPELLYIKSKRGADASGYYKGSRFVVKQGSKFASTTSPKCPKKYIISREILMLQKRVIPLGEQLLVMEDIEFDSPAAAMGAAIGGWVRGAHDWKEHQMK
ncbi:methionine sulfoxide reductase [Planococcus shenhongbingii]|uniref:methionine sulfoxide reductase n=1 Tax=Planococcus shenhongbingii TaxID=3058398 RepID=UPI00260E0F40|nr:methionine sulfoxide reductase [Planococcus sp. N016]WKA58253.1 methionine sulfoxide reductase [Planococcus sp. N016]